MTEETSFNQRIVRYEEIHSIAQNDFDALINAASPNTADRILDCGSGYGAVTRELLSKVSSSQLPKASPLRIDLIDESTVQLERAKQELKPWLNNPAFILTLIPGTFPDDLPTKSMEYDVVFSKMVLHEIPSFTQPEFVRRVYECLKKNGRFVFWDVCLSPNTAEFYRNVVRMKDHLAGYETMVERRNFLTEHEIRNLFDLSPFAHFELVKNITYQFDTVKRLEPEFRGDRVRFEEWQTFIRASAASIGASVLEEIHYQDDGYRIRFNVRKVIARAIRE